MRIEPGWNAGTLIEYLKEHCPQIDEDNEGQIVIYTGLCQTPDGGLTGLDTYRSGSPSALSLTKEIHVPQATIDTPRELMIHELGDLLFAEEMLASNLPKMAEEAADEHLKQDLLDHAEETKGQVENLKEAFQALGETPKAERCPGIEGIKKEHDLFFEENDVNPELVRDLFLIGSGERVENYEIAAYSSLLKMAEGAGESDVCALLTTNLAQEQAALEKLRTCSTRLNKAGTPDASA